MVLYTQRVQGEEEKQHREQHEYHDDCPDNLYPLFLFHGSDRFSICEIPREEKDSRIQ